MFNVLCLFLIFFASSLYSTKYTTFGIYTDDGLSYNNFPAHSVSPVQIKSTEDIHSFIKELPTTKAIHSVVNIDNETSAFFVTTFQSIGLRLIIVNRFEQPEKPRWSPLFAKDKLKKDFSTDCFLLMKDKDEQLQILAEYPEFIETCCFTSKPYIPNSSVYPLVISYTQTDVGTYLNIDEECADKSWNHNHFSICRFLLSSTKK